MTNSNMLKAKMVESGFTQRTLAKAVGLSVNALNRKINNISAFACDEVEAICCVLKITNPVDMAKIFLAKKSQ